MRNTTPTHQVTNSESGGHSWRSAPPLRLCASAPLRESSGGWVPTSSEGLLTLERFKGFLDHRSQRKCKPLKDGESLHAGLLRLGWQQL